MVEAEGNVTVRGHWWLKQTRMDGSQVPFLLQGQRGCPEVSVSERKAPRPWGNTSLRYVEHYLLGCELWGFSQVFRRFMRHPPCVVLKCEKFNKRARLLPKQNVSYFWQGFQGDWCEEQRTSDCKPWFPGFITLEIQIKTTSEKIGSFISSLLSIRFQ